MELLILLGLLAVLAAVRFWLSMADGRKSCPQTVQDCRYPCRRPDAVRPQDQKNCRQTVYRSFKMKRA